VVHLDHRGRYLDAGRDFLRSQVYILEKKAE